MTIQRKSKKNNEKAAAAFIGETATVDKIEAEAVKDIKVPVAMRFNKSLLANIDAAAKSQGISRNAWVSYNCAKALENE